MRGPRSWLRTLSESRLRGLLAIGCAIHLSAAFLLWGLAVTEATPRLVLPGGIGVFASDGVMYLDELAELDERLRSGEWETIVQANVAPHVGLFALSYIPFRPLFGKTILSVEPMNLLLFAITIAATWGLCRQFLSARSAFFPTLIVAVWPSLVLHSTQLLKTSFLLPALLVLALVHAALIRDVFRGWKAPAVAAAAIPVMLLAQHLRPEIVPVVIGMSGLALGAALVARWRSARTDWWSVSAVAFLLLVSFGPGLYQSLPAAESSGLGGGSYAKRESTRGGAEDSLARMIDSLHARVVFQRGKFLSAGGSSIIDHDFLPETTAEMVRYLPRAALIGTTAPFPTRWLGSGGDKVTPLGRLLVSVEMPFIYGLELLALLGLATRLRKEPAAWFFFLFGLLAMTALGLVVANVGTLYRLRYAHLVMLIPLAGAGLLRTRHRRVAR